LSGIKLTEIAVWSGDTVRRDADGFLYFIGRKDEMIKTSGYRVSPTEIEEVIYATGLVAEAAAFGVPHPTLGEHVGAGVGGDYGVQADQGGNRNT
jgi:acyl-coenzyme A synthetase/AMP-(fatty) acid ligase